jgi:hypothetical protein
LILYDTFPYNELVLEYKKMTENTKGKKGCDQRKVDETPVLGA